MKITSILSLLFSIVMVGLCQAQLDNNSRLPSGSLGGSTLNTGGFSRSSPGLTQKKSNLFLNTEKESRLEASEKKMDIREDEEFLDPTKKFTPKYLAKKEGEKGGEKYQKDQYFGEIKNNGKFIKISCRDHMAVDGDLVQVIVNGEVQIQKIYLDNSYKEVNISLEEGFNKIEIKALNQGSSGPNTAEFKVYDDKGNLISQNVWNLATGYKASLMVVKENINQN